jgi:hypothetical protein
LFGKPRYLEFDAVRRVCETAKNTDTRINAAHFMAELANDIKMWDDWKFKTPVLYNK